jgi:hypothetical protein
MPREKITDTTTTGFYTEVFWRRRPGLDTDDQGTSPGHVQIASVNDLSPFHFPDIDTGDHFEAGEKFDGWRITLDEDGIDWLIKTLHKAKRQAFGAARADEASRAYDSLIKDGVNPHKARRDAWASAGYSDDEIATFEQALAGG